MKDGKQVPLLTWMQIFGCICVIFGHSYPFVTPIPAFFMQLRTFIYSFHMPLFVFCSGVLLQISNSSEKYSFPKFLKKRFVRLLLPYFVFSLLGVVPKILLAPMLNDSLSLDAVALIRAFLVPRENIWGHFWFLPMVFFCGLIGFWGSKLFRRLPWIRWPVLAIAFAALFLPDISPWLSLDDLKDLLFYYILGMVCSGVFIDCSRNASFRYCLYGAGFAVLAIAIFLISKHFSVLNLANPVIACVMIAACAIGLLPLAHRIPITKDSLLNRSYSVFILSWPCQLIVELALERILTLSFGCIMPCMFAVGLVIPSLLIRLVDCFERNKKRKILRRIIGG